MHKTTMTPVGPVTLACTNGRLTQLRFSQTMGTHQSVSASTTEAIIIQQACTQLHEYFSGLRKIFHLPFQLNGTEFQRQAWQQLIRIPYGETRSYGWQCQAIAHPQAARAIGNANQRNPLAIIVPCHRIIRADGSLSGYSGGVPAKVFLHALENVNML